MTDHAPPLKREPRTGEFLSAKYLLLRAGAMVVLFLMVHLAGLREYTTFLSGTIVNPQTGFRLSAFYGMLYIALYLGSVVVAPICVIAAALLVLYQKTLFKTSSKLP